MDFTGVKQGNHYPLTDKWTWLDETLDGFIDNLEVTHTRNLKHKEEYFKSFFKTQLGPYSKSYSPILITKAVWDGLKKSHPNSDYIEKTLFSKIKIEVRDYSGDVYGGDVTFTAVKEYESA